MYWSLLGVSREGHPIIESVPEHWVDNLVTVFPDQIVFEAELVLPPVGGLIHSAQLVDKLPLCKPVECWDNVEFEATTDNEKVTCVGCLAVIQRMKEEIGDG